MSEPTLWSKLTVNSNGIQHGSPALFAFYNTAFLVMLGICLAGLYALYQMLHLFLTPILWAVLVGTVLFPLKRTVSSVLAGWLSRLDDQNTPLLIGIVFLPLNAVNVASETVYHTVFSSNGVYYLAGYISLKALSYKGTFVYVLSLIGAGYSLFDDILAFLTQRSVLILVCLYAVTYAAWIFVQDYETLHAKKKFARSLSLPIWIVVLANVASLCGPIRVVVFSICAVALGLISAGLIGDKIKSENNVKNSFHSTEEEEPEKDNVDETFGGEEASDHVSEVGPPSLDQSRLDQSISSDTHLRCITGLVLLLFAARYDTVVAVAVFLFLYAFFKAGAERSGACETVVEFLTSLYVRVENNMNKLVNIVVAGSLRDFVHILFTSDKYLINSLKKKVDFIASVVVMVILAFGLFFFLIFTVFQVHSETVHLARLATSVVSSNPQWLRSALNYTDLNEDDIDGYVDQAYQQGRSWVASNIRQLADPKDTKRADELEEQAKLIVDHLYQMWEERQADVKDGQLQTRPDWFSQLMSASNLDSLKSELTTIVKQNIETVLTVAQSLWSVLLLNLSLLSTVLASVVGLVLSFGFDLFNFFIEVVVFLTMVYYMLASSSDQWLPLHWISEAVPTLNAPAGSQFDLAKSIETAISGVFVLSAKMSIFYGLYTYFTHVLFDLNIVFVPSFVAACLASVPIMPPYSVSVFGLVELFLVRGESAAAIFFVLANVAPMMFVDSAFYREVKSSHPYVTGLAVIGGIYWIGLQGAVIGPIILCCFLILFEIYAQFAQNNK